MTRTIRARFKGGVLEPLEKIDLPEGGEVTVTISVPAKHNIEAFRRAAGRLARESGCRGADPQHLCRSLDFDAPEA